MERVLIKPKAGLCVRDPKTYQKLAPEGEVKTNSKYWRRLAKAGDVEISQPSGSAKPKAPEKGGDK